MCSMASRVKRWSRDEQKDFTVRVTSGIGEAATFLDPDVVKLDGKVGSARLSSLEVWHMADLRRHFSR